MAIIEFRKVKLILKLKFPLYSETSGLGVKMVEYVLGSSPTTPKELEPRMVSLRLVSIQLCLIASHKLSILIGNYTRNCRMMVTKRKKKKEQ